LKFYLGFFALWPETVSRKGGKAEKQSPHDSNCLKKKDRFWVQNRER
jgi:hypothetical protein